MIVLTYAGFGFADLRKRLDPKLIDKALNSAMEKTAKKVRTHIKSQVRERYNIKAGDIAKAVKIKKVFGRDGGRLIAYSGGYIGLDKFGARSKRVKSARGWRRGVTVQVRKDRGRKLVKRGFLGHGANNNGPFIFTRKGATRMPIRRRYSLSIPRMVGAQLTVQSVNEKVGQELPKEFAHAMDYFLGKVK